MRKKIACTIVLFLGFLTIGISQGNDLKGTLTLKDGTNISGTFSNKVSKSTSFLKFVSETGSSYNVQSEVNALLYYTESGKQYKNCEIKDGLELLEVLVYGDANLYKSLKTQNLYVENTKLKTGTIELINPEKISTSRTNKGKLLVVFEDCLEVRTRTYDSEMSINRISQLMEAYNNCEKLSDNFEITKQEEANQAYSDQKTLINFDLGGGYFGLDNDIAIITEDAITRDSADSGGMSIYASLNISPAYFNNYMGNIYLDFSLQYNFNQNVEFSDIDKELSSLILSFTPKYYFGDANASIRPFVGFGLGIGLLSFNIEDKTGAVFNTVDDSVFRFFYSPQIGLLLFNNLEVSADFYPYYSNNLLIESGDVRLESTFTSFTVKLGYHF